MTNLGVFDKTQRKTAHWIESVAQNMGSTDMERSYHVLRFGSACGSRPVATG